jgi:RNA polymerase sigma factor (sigma-70 family)
MTDSHKLLAEYVAGGSETAFRDLVTRYLDLVYSAAVRLVDGDTHLAEDVAQKVFVDLAGMARTLPKEVMLGGWLHRHTCYVAATTKRGERRRQARERQAAQMNALQDHSGFNLAEIGPMLDEAINQLETEDRTAILLRFFEQLDFRAVGQAIGSSDEAAKKRVSRALDKLHRVLTARGFTLSATALAAGLATEAVKAAPIELVTRIAVTSIGSAAMSHAAHFSLLKAMTTSKLSLGVASVLVIAGAAFSIKQHQIEIELRDQNNSLRQQMEQLATGAQGLSNQLAQAQSAQSEDNGHLRELMRLRGEVGMLKKQLAETPRVSPKAAPQAQASDNSIEQQKQVAIGKMRDAKIWVFSLHQYAEEHQRQFPTNFDQVSSYLDVALKSDLNPGENLRDKQEFAQTTNDFEIVYQGSLNEITNWARTIVMREKEPWQGVNGGWNRTYGFADGHTEIHKAEDGNFGPWEAQRLQKASGL